MNQTRILCISAICFLLLSVFSTYLMAAPIFHKEKVSSCYRYRAPDLSTLEFEYRDLNRRAYIEFPFHQITKWKLWVMDPKTQAIVDEKEFTTKEFHIRKIEGDWVFYKASAEVVMEAFHNGFNRTMAVKFKPNQCP